ncbi:MAG: DUF5666 domain-containing protein [candidate division Zixibacteria bacterium]|nr:DUF5666 domain-containing protein [candidate division Zixibacteria bacterium]MDH3935756.1 DUF5666 domain-containing protein [candidate division Zixibacteria bacterium]MDH4032553.1 DUF5666 domain-containing protein [candidate division Zixibacteria bacterium]
MSKVNRFALTATMGLALLVMLVAGCSKQSPVGPSLSTSDGEYFLPDGAATGGDVDLYGRVATIDSASRMMTLVGNPTNIEVAADAEVVWKDDGNEIPIDLSEINPGDSVDVRGTMTGGNSLLADRVRVRANDTPENELETSGRVETVDPALRTITLVGVALQINVAAGAEIVQKHSGVETVIELSDILPGDSVDIRGDVQTDGSLLANRVRVRDGDDFRADLEFYGTVTEINYAESWLTVDSRTEKIFVDSNTSIFVKSGSDPNGGALAKRGGGDDDDDDGHLPIYFAFEDIMVGDSLEVHANVVNESTLYAVAIEIEDGAANDNMQVEVKDTLATVDVEARTITLVGQAWTGIVNENADLRGLNDELLTLADFGAGELVEVKGFAQSDGTVLITRMHKDNN